MHRALHFYPTCYAECLLHATLATPTFEFYVYALNNANQKIAPILQYEQFSIGLTPSLQVAVQIKNTTFSATSLSIVPFQWTHIASTFTILLSEGQV